MGEIRLGKIHLRWCDSCNVPVLEQSTCSVCRTKTREAHLTPPGDARPAFDADIHNIRSLIDRQFGPGTGEAAIPQGRVVLLNKAPDIDRMDEVIVDGEVIGAMRFELVKGNRFLLRPKSAIAIAPFIRGNWIRIDNGAAEAIQKQTASALAVGVVDCAPDIEPGMEILVLGPSKEPISVGVAKMSSSEMMLHPRGTAVKTRWVVGSQTGRSSHKEATWSDVVLANREVMTRRIEEAKQFILQTIKKSKLPVAVSYSGGKDSLATLLLVLDAGVRPTLLFVDTGLEFPETVRNVSEIARQYSLGLVVESAGESFWKNLAHFGPPAKDFRWCCKTCKLGPATRLIQKNFPQGVLSFIGQRAYESQERARKGSVWKNPWTPNQLAASPIQKWTALHVWIYLFMRKANVNPLYAMGLERIGCFMCPATDLSELRRVEEISPEYARWRKTLDEFAEKTGRTGPWLEYDLWRWKRIPESVIAELGDIAPSLQVSTSAQPEVAPLEFRSTSGYSPCVEGLSMEGIFSAPLRMDRVANLLNAIGAVQASPDGRIAEVRHITIFAEGPVIIRAKDEFELNKKTWQLKHLVFRAMNCAGCGICLGRCTTGALHLDGQVKIDPDKCNHCEECIGPCPVVHFREEELDI